MQGWFKFHRVLFEKPIWITSTPEQKTILITLMGMANHKENEWEFKGEKFTVKQGQFITSLDSIAEKSGKGVTVQNVRTALKRFEKYEFLTNESTNKNRLITIVNWGIYQGEDDEPNKQTNKQLTSNQQATNKQLTTNKNVRMFKNEKKDDETVLHPDKIINALMINEIITRSGINHTLAQDLNDIEDNFGFDNFEEMVLAAITESARANASTWKYVYNKLFRWKKEGYKKPSDVQEPKTNFKKNESGNSFDDYINSLEG